MLNILSSKHIFIFSCFLFRVALDCSYIYFIYPVFSSSEFSLNFSLPFYLISWLLYSACVFLTPYRLLAISDYFLTSFLLAVIAPISSMSGLKGDVLYPVLVVFVVFLFFRTFQYGSLASKLMPIPKLLTLKEGRIISIYFTLACLLILVFWYFYTGAYRYFNLNLLKVYEFREKGSELTHVGFFSYITVWGYNVFSIFLMAYSLYRRSYIVFIFVLILQIFFFGVSHHKSVIFYPFMVISIWFYFRKTRALAIIPLAFTSIVVICLAMYLIFDHIVAGSLLIRRVFFVPANLTFRYFEFFEIGQHVYWSNSVLSPIFDYPYDLNVGRVVASHYGSEASSNNGFIASGYAHAGLLGVVIYSFIFSYFIKFLDVVVHQSDVPVWLALCMTIVPLRAALISSDLFTSMITHGLVLTLILVLLFRRPSYPPISYSAKNE